MKTTGISSCRPSRTVLVAVLVLLTAANPASTYAVTVGLFSDAAAWNCDAQEPPLHGTVSVYVAVYYSLGITGLQFTVSTPSCGGFQLVGWQPLNGMMAIGQPESGIQLFGSCTGDRVSFLRLDYQRVSAEPIECCSLRLLPHPDAITGEVETVDCSFTQILAARADAFWLVGDDQSCAPIPPPANPVPTDGHIDVPLALSLSCSLYGFAYHSSCMPLGSDWVKVFFGTVPDPPLVGNGGPFPYPLTGLSPATKYYWRVEYSYWGGGPVSSPLWSFTTASTTPVTTSTWGRIKALYR